MLTHKSFKLQQLEGAQVDDALEDTAGMADPLDPTQNNEAFTEEEPLGTHHKGLKEVVPEDSSEAFKPADQDGMEMDDDDDVGDKTNFEKGLRRLMDAETEGSGQKPPDDLPLNVIDMGDLDKFVEQIEQAYDKVDDIIASRPGVQDDVVVDDRNFPETPIQRLPYLIHPPHQTLAFNLPGTFWKEKDLDDVKIGECMTGNREAVNGKRLLMFMGAVVHDMIRGLDYAPKEKKEKKGKGDGEGEGKKKKKKQEEEPDFMLAQRVADKETFIRNADGQPNEMFKQDNPEDPTDKIPVPRVLVLFERLMNDTPTMVGVRVIVCVFDPDLDINKAIHERIKRIAEELTAYEDQKRKRPNVNPPPFSQVGDHSILRKVDSVQAWRQMLMDYYGVNHEVTAMLNDRQSEIEDPDNHLAGMNPAKPTEVLTLRHAMRYKTRPVCKLQTNVDSYLDAGDNLARFPLAPCTWAMRWNFMKPADLHKEPFPKSRIYSTFVQVKRIAHLKVKGSMPKLTCTDEELQAIRNKASTEDDALGKTLVNVGKLRGEKAYRSVKDEHRDMDIVEQMAPENHLQRMRIANQLKPGSLEYSRKMREFKVANVQHFWEEVLCKYVDLKELFSPVYVAAMEKIVSSAPEEMWPQWFMAVKNMDPHANVLFMLFYRLTHLYRIKEGANQRKAMLHYFAALTSCHYHRRIKTNLMDINSGSSSKSFMMMLVEFLLLESSVQRLTHVTANAFNVQGSRNFITTLIEEANPAWFGIGATGQRIEGELQNNIKSMMTAQETVTIMCFIDKETGQRMQKRSVSSAIGSFQVAMNTPADAVSSKSGKAEDQAAEMQRFLVAQPNPAHHSSTVSLRDLVAMLSDEQDMLAIKEFEHEMHLIHAYGIVLNMMIGAGILHPVNNDLGALVMRQLNRKMKEAGLDQIAPRTMEMLSELMIAICWWSAIVIVMGGEYGYKWRHKKGGHMNKFGPEMLLEIEKLLVVNSQHVMFALTLVGENLVPLARQEVIRCLASMRKEFNAEPLKTHAGNSEAYIHPHLLVYQIGSVPSLASRIAEHSPSEITSQQVLEQLNALGHVTMSGTAVTKVAVKMGGEDVPKAQIEDEVNNPANKNPFSSRVITSPPKNISEAGQGGSQIVVLKEALEGSKSIGPDWLVETLTEILSHNKTKKRQLLHAGVLKVPASKRCIQRALGVTTIKCIPGKLMVFSRSTYISHEHKSSVSNRVEVASSLPEGNNRMPFMVFNGDHDEVLLKKHHTTLGILEGREMLPWRMHAQMMDLHAERPDIFSKQESGVYEEYPQSYIQAFDRDRKLESLMGSLTPEMVDRYMTIPGYRDIIFGVAEESETDKAVDQLRKNRDEGTMESEDMNMVEFSKMRKVKYSGDAKSKVVVPRGVSSAVKDELKNIAEHERPVLHVPADFIPDQKVMKQEVEAIKTSLNITRDMAEDLEKMIQEAGVSKKVGDILELPEGPEQTVPEAVLNERTKSMRGNLTHLKKSLELAKESKKAKKTKRSREVHDEEEVENAKRSREAHDEEEVEHDEGPDEDDEVVPRRMKNVKVRQGARHTRKRMLRAPSAFDDEED